MCCNGFRMVLERLQDAGTLWDETVVKINQTNKLAKPAGSAVQPRVGLIISSSNEPSAMFFA